MHNLLDLLPIGVWILDEKFRVEAVNLQIQEFFGISVQELIGQDKRPLVENRIHTIFENGEEFRRRLIATYDQNTYSENFLCHVTPAPGRKERWLEHFSQPLERDGRITGRVEVYFDVTERIKYEQELDWISHQFILVQEQEKARIANNLHNDIGQSVIALKLSLERLQNSLCPTGQTLHRPIMSLLFSQLEGIARDISQISNDLLPQELGATGIQETLTWMANYYQSLYGLKVDCQVFGVNDKHFAPDLEIALYRFFQEALNNVVKHAESATAQCVLTYSYPRIIAVVSDQGKGFDKDQITPGAGLRIIQHRVAELGGSLTITAAPGSGTRIRAVFPATIAEQPTRTMLGNPIRV